MAVDLNLERFELYCLARQYSRVAWGIFKKLPKQIQYMTGAQFLESADSVQANLAEAYGRFHFKDKRNFEYHARGSLLESLSWSEILIERGFIETQEHQALKTIGQSITFKLNSHIRFLTDQIESSKSQS